MAAGPGIRPAAPDAPFGSGRSALNYPHLVAERAGFDLVDVTFSGATTAHVLSEPQRGAPPQISALDGSEALVTVTIGGNDVGYVPLLMAASAPKPFRLLPIVGSRIRVLLDPAARDRALVDVAESLRTVGATLRSRAPKARIMFVTYLTLLPPPGIPAGGLTEAQAHLGRHVADRLAQLTEYAAASTGCEVVPVAAISRDHHAWSTDPWTVGAGWPIPGRPAPFHPNVAGMRAVADLVLATLGPQ
jgi:lysophospholipase L1-like esterase